MNKGKTSERRIPWADLGLIALVVGFIALVIVDSAARVASVWPYLILHDLHYHLSRFALAVALAMAAAAAYIGLGRRGDVTPLFRRATYVVFGTMLIQALVGLAMYVFFYARPGQDVHLIYGLGTVLALPFFIFVETTAKKRPAMGSYIWGFTLLAGIIVRSIMTGAV